MRKRIDGYSLAQRVSKKATDKQASRQAGSREIKIDR